MDTKINKYAIVENGVVINIIKAYDDFAKSQEFIFIEDNIKVDIGYLYNGSTFSENPEIISAKLENEKIQIRAERDRLIAETDFWLLPDRIVTQEQLDYRQALRDVPQQEGFPENVIWPEKP